MRNELRRCCVESVLFSSTESRPFICLHDQLLIVIGLGDGRALDNNKLTGAIPEWLAMLPNLKELYVSPIPALIFGSHLYPNVTFCYQIDFSKRMCIEEHDLISCHVLGFVV